MSDRAHCCCMMFYVRADGVETCQIRDRAAPARNPRSVRRGALAEARRLLGGTSPRFFTRAPAGFWGESYCGLSRSRAAPPPPDLSPTADRATPAATRPRARRPVERRGGWRPGTPAARGTPPSGGRRPRVTNIPASVCESWSWTVPAFWPEPRRRRVGMRFRAEARGTSRLLRARVRSSTRWMSYATNDVKRYNIRSRFARVLRCPLGHENPKWAGVANTPRPRSLW